MAGALTAAIAAAFSGVTPDPYFEYTTLLLPGNGPNLKNNNEFLDSSANAFTITRNPLTGPNAPTQGTFSPFSQTGWGNYFDGNGDYLSSPYGTGFNLTGDFTIECWVNASYLPTATGSGTQLFPRIFSFGTYNAANSLGLEVNTNDPGFVRRLVVWYNGTSYNSGTNNDVTTNQWYHLAVVRNGTVITIYKDGAVSFSITGASAAVNTSQAFYIATLQGLESNTSACWNGYISNLRVVKGRAVYTAAFTPPTSPLTRTTGGTNPPQGTETSLLTCQSSRFLDSNGVNISASSPLTITVNGNTSVVAFSPFNPTASWSAATYGGSGYFDGSGDYLTVSPGASFAFGTGNFTVEIWYYPTTTVASEYLIDNRTSGQWVFTYNWTGSNSGTLYWYDGSTALAQTTGSTIANAWNHIVYVRSGTTGSMYINGARVATQTDSTNYSASPTTSYIGARYTGTTPANGYFSGLRVVKGTAVYDPTQTTITVPTAPLTAITNTSLLLNFTNAGIYDATSKNDLETVGNAQISTAQYKFPPSSMAFDGTGDYLVGPSNFLFNFGSSDFTMEGWFNQTGLSNSYPGIMSNPITFSAGAWAVLGSHAATGVRKLQFYCYNYSASAPLLLGTTTLSDNTWYYFAVTRSGSTFRLFLNGTIEATTTFAGSMTSADNGIAIGTNQVTSGFPFQGYLQDIRVTRGYARYTANFTPPTAAFPTL